MPINQPDLDLQSLDDNKLHEINICNWGTEGI